MKTALTIAVFSSLIQSSAFAAMNIQCGKVDKKEYTVAEIVFEVSAGDDDFTGKINDGWSAWVDGAGLEYRRKDPIKAKYNDDTNTLVVTDTRKISIGKVGKVYTITGVYTDYPKLTIKTVGGIAAGITQTFECLGSYD